MRKLTQEEYNNTIKPLIIGDDVLKDRLCSSGYCIDEEQTEGNAEYIIKGYGRRSTGPVHFFRII